MGNTVYRITADQVHEGQYSGPALSNFDGSIEADAHLGMILFAGNLRVTGSIRFEAGSGIKAGSGINAGEGIKAGFSIRAGWLSSPLRIFAGLCLWRHPEAHEMEIVGDIRSGIIGYGTHLGLTR